ncbi:formylglycine-generating enzyme family protein [Fulvivirga sp. M361]|nr:formylglycine-generating enzyme family protein [Fulvivirga sp. M361]
MEACSPPSEESNGADTPEGMVLIPGNQFEMGGKSDQAYQDEFPRHEVKVGTFYMDVTEVTNAQFARFIEETGYVTIAERDIDWEEIKKQVPEGTPKPPDSVLRAGSLVFKETEDPVQDFNDYSQWWQWTTAANWRQPEGPGSSIEGRMDHPAVHIAWDDAQAYAQWAGKRLPTEAEWEWASMGGLKDVKYPWGNTPIAEATDKANFWQGIFPHQNHVLDGHYGTAPVKSFSANGYGLYDMAGNVWEWCNDKYDFSAYQKDAAKGLVSNPLGSEQYYDPREPYSPKHVIRGGSFLCNDSYCSGYRVARRMSSSKDSGFNHTGFRCVKDLN